MNTSKYDEDFKKSIVTLVQNGKSQSQISKEYGVSLSAISRWIKLYSTVTTDDGDILTLKQVKAMQKRLSQLEEENLILKPYSRQARTKIKCCSHFEISA